MVSTSRAIPSTAAFAAPSDDTGEVSVPMNWKPDQTAGSTTCRASAAAATTTI